ncbi:MAG TPA: hypothetical protein ENI99_06410 [Sedimenticola sp.]|nr:hypothetical protein [Sedimenticola sp.]
MELQRTLLLLLILAGCCPAMADDPLEIIRLKGRTADEIIPLIRPFAGPDGAITGTGNQLIIRTSPERMADIRKILEKIDRPPRRLMIYVRQGRLTDSEHQRISAGANVDIGDHATVEIGDKAPKETVRLRARDQRTRSNLDITQRIQTLEGKPAYIATGKAIPIQEQGTVISGGVIYQQATTRYRDTTAGFYVIPQLNGDRVTLRISSHLDRPGQIHGTFEVQQARTTVSGRLGEWLPIGGADQTEGRTGTGLVRRHTTASRDERQIFLLVEEIP